MSLDKRQAVAHYGMAQLSLLQGTVEVTNAVSLLEAALAAAPAWPDALKVRQPRSCPITSHRCPLSHSRTPLMRVVYPRTSY